MEIAVLVGTVVAIIAILANGIVVVPTVRYGVVTRFRRRTGRILTEGIHLVLSFVDQVQIYPHELRTDSLDKIDVFSQDRLEITMQGSAQWRPDKNNLRTFVEIPENTILVGLKDAIKSELGKIAGDKTGDDFIRERKAIETLINCIFRLERPPHFHQNEERNGSRVIGFEMGESLNRWIDDARAAVNKIRNPEEQSKQHKKIDKLDPRLLDQDKWQCPTLLKVDERGRTVSDLDKEGNAVWDVIGFYNRNAAKVKLMLDVALETSPIERLYGIDIATFRLADVDFSAATKQALERRRQAIADLGAAEEQQKRKLVIMKELKDQGLTPEQANNAADVIIGVAAPRQVISIEGGGVLPLLNIQPTKKAGER